MGKSVVPPKCCGQYMREDEKGFYCEKCHFVVKADREMKERRYKIKVELGGGRNG